MTTKLALVLALTACADLEAEEAADVEQESRTTSVSTLPNSTVLAHLDDSPGTNLLQFTGNRLFVTRSDAAATPVMHHYFDANISQLIVGDFARPGTRESGHDQVCAKLVDGSLQCFAPSDDRTQLWAWFSQPNPLVSGEQAIVGDFTGDGADDILAFNAGTGTIRLLDRTITGTFAARSYALGNLASVDLRGKQLYAGEFGQVVGRTDLLVVDPVARNVAAYATANDANGNTTFWWGWTTGANTLVASEQITIANIEGGSRDGLILRDPATGRIRLMRAAYGSGYLDPIPTSVVSPGQIPVTTHSAQLAAVRLPSTDTELGGAVRDDILFFDRTDVTLQQVSARYDGTKLTYWWAYTKGTPSVASWPAPQRKMALVLCKVADQAREPNKPLMVDRVLGRGTGSVRDYLIDVTHGGIDIATADVYGWVQGTLNAADSSARVGDSGLKTGDYIADCMEAAGITSAQYSGHVLVIMNETNVAKQGIPFYGSTSEYNQLESGDLRGVTHELLHAFGLRHAHDDTGNICGGGDYCDTWDLMGNYYATQAITTTNTQHGPGLNAAHLEHLGVLPSARIYTVDPTRTTQTIALAALEKPEAGGALLAKIKVSDTMYFTIELRESIGYDRNVPVGVQIHSVDQGDPNGPNRTILRALQGRTLVAGQIATVANFWIRVDAIDSTKHQATITITR